MSSFDSGSSGALFPGGLPREKKRPKSIFKKLTHNIKHTFENIKKKVCLTMLCAYDKVVKLNPNYQYVLHHIHAGWQREGQWCQHTNWQPDY